MKTNLWTQLVKKLIRKFWEEKEKYLESLIDETDRGKCLIAASFFEYQLGLILENKLVNGGKDKKRLFEFNGPLRTFSSRIDMAFYLGLFGKKAKRDLHIMRKIRNEFAYRYEPLTLNFTTIKNKENKKKWTFLMEIENLKKQ